MQVPFARLPCSVVDLSATDTTTGRYISFVTSVTTISKSSLRPIHKLAVSRFVRTLSAAIPSSWRVWQTIPRLPAESDIISMHEMIDEVSVLFCLPRGRKVYSKAIADLLPGFGLRFPQIRASSDRLLRITIILHLSEREQLTQRIEWIH